MSVRVSNHSDPDQHQDECEYRPKGARDVAFSITCQPPRVGRYISIRRLAGDRVHVMTFCEAVVIGYRLLGNVI